MLTLVNTSCTGTLITLLMIIMVIWTYSFLPLENRLFKSIKGGKVINLFKQNIFKVLFVI